MARLKNIFSKDYFLHCLSKIKKSFKPKLGHLYHYSAVPLKIPRRYEKFSVLSSVPTISIVTPAFKHAHFLERTIQSVLQQGYPNLEYVVQDGASEDGTVEILQKYKHVLKHWASERDNGQSHAINLGFKHTSGEIMAYLNSDDLLLPGTLHYVAEFFAKNPTVDVVYGHRVLIDEDEQEVGRWVLPPHDNQVLSWADYIPQETLFWRRRIWNAVGGEIDENFKFAMDWDLLLRFRDAGAHFARLPRFLGAFRVHPQQKSSAQISKTGQEEMEILRFRCHGRVVQYDEIHANLRKYMLQHIMCHKLYSLGILPY